MVSNKSAFWQALILSSFIFGLGIILGFFLEGSRADKIELNVMKSEISVLDEQLRNRILEDSTISCALGFESTFSFADDIYDEAVKLEKYDAASKFRSMLKVVHTRYDLLRMQVWADALYLKKNCSTDIHTIVYFFQYDTEDVDIKAQQTTFSRLLVDLKEQYPGEILLIPIAANLDLNSVELAMQVYKIKKTPSILIDEQEVVDEIVTFEALENLVFQSNKA